ncbi:hypothetical protein DPMN_017857, partial [Dreissena polymorpha]
MKQLLVTPRRGGILLCSCRSICRIMKLHRYIDHDSQMTPIDFEVTRIMKLHGYIDHDSQMTPIDFEITRSKVKVT